MKKGLITLCLFAGSLIYAQQEVPVAVMQQIYAEIKTPYKYGLVVTPKTTQKKSTAPPFSAKATTGT